MTTLQNFPSVIRREKLQQVKPHGKWRSEAKNMRRGPKWGGPGDYSRAILWLCSVMGVRGGKHGEGQANEQAQRSRTVWVHRGMTAGGGGKGQRARAERRGRGGGRKEGMLVLCRCSRCRGNPSAACVASAQQCASGSPDPASSKNKSKKTIKKN